jgi:2-oxoglutarate ferredoxin oxidoreductase subunit beta
MVTIEDYGKYETAWCPGCGNFSILDAVKRGLVASELEPHQVLLVSGIGQAAKAPHYLNANVFNGLHGRALPVATGAKLANPDLRIIVESGDGCNYGEGGNHFLAAIRRNIDLTLIVHNNQIYGLTKGQASPTTMEGFVTKAQPEGVASAPFNPIAVAVALLDSLKKQLPMRVLPSSMCCSHVFPSTRSTLSPGTRSAVIHSQRNTMPPIGKLPWG